ncbi:MAG: hypothetical protein IPJ37_09035 [Bacteroidales bacterium]|nr:hypothetical protein [Bacteroidales bacterium]
MPGGILNLDYYVLPENLETARKHFRQVKDVINIYSDAYGEYPWIREGFKLVEGPFEGMEHQTAIAYGSGYQDLPWLGGDYIIVHETAHGGGAMQFRSAISVISGYRRVLLPILNLYLPKE